MFGVDKRNLGSFTISRQHDFERLFSHDNVKINTRGEKMALYDQNTGEKIEFQCLTINKDERFESLYIGVKKIGRRLEEYVKINVFITHDEDKKDKGTGNLKPINQRQVIEAQEELLEYIREKYGLNIYQQGMRYTYLEINKTIQVNEDVDAYGNLTGYMKYIVPKKYKRRNLEEDNKNEWTLLVLQNESVKIKIYNKTKQLKEYKQIEVDKNYMRIEVCLKDSKKIKDVFGTTLVEGITDEMMWEYYKKVIEKDIFTPLEKQLKKSKPELKKELEFQRRKDAKKYPKTFLTGVCSLLYKDTKIPLILDVEQAIEVLKPTVARWDRTYKVLKEEIDKRPHKKNNLARLDEIKNKTLFN